MSRYPVLRIKRGKERSLIHRHPWIFSGAIERVDAPGPDAVVEIRFFDGTLVGYGHFAHDAPIRCRVFEFCDEEKIIDADYWRGKFCAAVEYRRPFICTLSTTAYRLLNGEGDGFPGVVFDRYFDAGVLQMRTPGAAMLAPLLAEFAREEGLRHVLWRGDEANVWLMGHKPEAHFREHGFWYSADLECGQKTGFFLDQRNHRKLTYELADGRRTLNAFSYTGGFAVCAAKGGAVETLSVDLSADALSRCERHFLENGISANHRVHKADVFDYLRTLNPGEFDFVILDPPAFTKHPSTVENAARGYKDLNMKAMRILPPGGLLMTFSCSRHISADLFQKIVFSAAADAKREARILYRLSHPEDHPVSIFHPEGEYLKGLVLVLN
jgi:23S rRNA (cytosine1962-C5)-methyltransferase